MPATFLNTKANIGIRRSFSIGYRNFEPNGVNTYNALREPTVFLGTTYHKGQTLTKDVGGITYSKKALQELENLWNNGSIAPDNNE